MLSAQRQLPIADYLLVNALARILLLLDWIASRSVKTKGLCQP
jgi:hypothetical protein